MAGWISAALAVSGALALGGVWFRHRAAHLALKAPPEPQLALVEVGSDAREIIVLPARRPARLEREPARAALR